MDKILIQYWEESERGFGIRPDGASLHKDYLSHKNYVGQIYNVWETIEYVPNEYDRVIGKLIYVSVNSELYNLVLSDNLRITQYQLNNLIKTNDIIIND